MWNEVDALTSKAGCDKDSREATKTAHERGTRDVPVLSANILVGLVASNIDDNTEDDEDNYSDDLQ